MTGGGVGDGTIGLFLGESQVPMSMLLCLPGIIGGGGIPGFFLTVVLVVLICGLAGWLAIVAHVIFLGASFCCSDAFDKLLVLLLSCDE